jgi:hypothetical protein
MGSQMVRIYHIYANPMAYRNAAQFCLLEQILPDGEDHPFAQTMMAHFAKLRTPLGAIRSYPTKSAQKRRFESLGWKNVNIHNLWELWNSSDFLSMKERSLLDSIETFDEVIVVLFVSFTPRPIPFASFHFYLLS